MASSIPTQVRIVDPFASYNSNVVNKITQIVTQDSNGLLTTNSLQVTLDSTSPLDTVVVSTGYIVKDDVVINITANHRVDFNDPDQYVSGAPVLTVGGFYYLVLDYTYVKSRPAPEASIKILKPTERGLLITGSQYSLLKVIELDNVGPHPIINLYDKDPSTPTNARQYLKYYAGSTVDLPTFSKTRDQSRVAYETAKDKFYFGYSNEWRELAAGGISIDVNTDSTGVTIGMLCYVDNNRDAIPAIATGFDTGADLAVLSIGTATEGTGRGSVAGFVENVPVESGLLIDVGDLLYLSATEAGKVTNIKTAPKYQVVGRSLSQGSATTPIDIIFSPKVVLSLGFEGQISTWLGPDGDGNYYKNIDVSSLDGTNAFDCHWFDNSDHTEITPYAVKILANGSVIRVVITDSTTVVDYVISSAGTIGGAGGAGEGGAGVTDHSLLTSLDYASSGHTGFAPTPHNNAHHSQTYIEASGVSFANLNANGDVGIGAAQVAFGNHTHPGYIDVPSGAILLFESDTAISGYTLLTTRDDAVVYITKGSAAGGESGGSYKAASTWSQPTHNHGIPNQVSHSHSISSDAASHNHKWYDLDGNNAYSFSSGGGSTPITRATLTTGTSRHITVKKASNLDGTFAAYALGSDFWTANSSATHNHGGSTGNAGSHNHGGSTNTSGTPSSWRPKGYNFTRQQRI